MTKIVTFRMTRTEEDRMVEAAERLDAHPDNFMRRAVVARTEDVLSQEPEVADDPPEEETDTAEEAEPEGDPEPEPETEEEEEPEPETEPHQKTCGDLGGLTASGKPCSRKSPDGFSRCAAHRDEG